MPITNISLLRKNLFSTIDSVIQYNEPVVVNTKKGNAVILSEEDYNALMETIYLTAQPGLVESIKTGEKENPKDMTNYDPDEEW